MTHANADAARGEEGGRDWESALLLLVPAAEPAVAKHRATLDASARYGVPAHLTVLYPFLPPGLIDDAVLASLGDLFAGVAGFRLTLDRVGWFGDDVVWLGPRDEAPLRALTGLAFAAFPSCAPYGGQHADVVPHLTVGHLGGASALRAAGEAVRHRLPIEAAATKVTLMTGPPTGNPGTSPGRWRTMAEFGFGRPGRLPEPSGLSLAGPFGMTAGRCGPMLVLFPPRWHYLRIGRW
ncbi:MAG: 2'-5' RNA ligase family protein [Trebonia sp.]